jgi:hypothetical protein
MKSMIHGAVLLIPLTALGACSEEPARETVTPESAAPEEPATTEDEAAEAHAAHEMEDSAGTPQPIRTDEDGSILYGTELDEALAVTPLATLMSEPQRFDGQVVKTEGEIAQVCQRMGCWMELRPDDDSPAIRVPMAGHSFFLPRDVAGRRAVVQGTVEVQELSEDWQRHLREEGAEAADAPIGIQAAAVLVHAPT